MAVKKNAPVQAFPEEDPAVAAARGQSDAYEGYSRSQSRIKKARQMTPGQRRKAEKDKLRSRYTFDMSPDLIAELERIAGSESIPVSQLASALMISGLEAFTKGQLFLKKKMCRSPRHDWLLDLPKVPKVVK